LVGPVVAFVGQVVALDFAGGKAEVGRHQVRQDFLAEDRKSGSLSGLPMFYGYRRLNKLLVPRVEDAIKSCIA
jgi:hypothetical protein